MAIENTPSEGLTLDQAFEQLQASRNPAPQEEQLEDENSEEVVDASEDSEEFEEEVTGEEDELDSEDDDDQESEEGEEESEGSDEEIFEVEIDGETVEVTGDELLKGYLRHNDYTRKRQADAKKARDLETSYQEKLSQLDQALSSNISAEEASMQQIAQALQSEQDDGKRQQLHYQYLQLQQRVQQRAQQLARVQQQAELTKQANAEAVMAEQQQLLAERFEDWDTRREVLKSYLTGQGFTDLSPFVNLQMAELVDKAKQFDDLQQTRETVVKKKLKRKVPKTIKAGQGEKKFNIDQERTKKLANNFNESRSLKDAFELMKARRGQS